MGEPRLRERAPTDRGGYPVCSHREHSLLHRDPRYDESRNRDIVGCKSCGLAYVTPLVMQDYETIPLEFYEKGIWEDTRGYVDNLRALFQRFEAAVRQLSPAVSELPDGARNLLEVGCGLGYFLDIARARGWNTLGLEIWEASTDWARRYLGLDVRRVEIDDVELPSSSLHAVAMIEVLEHLEDPRRALRRAWDLLHPQGVLFVTTPNFGTLYRIKTGWDWDVIDPYGHIQYFTMDTLHRCARTAGFRQVTIGAAGGETDDVQLLMWARKN